MLRTNYEEPARDGAEIRRQVLATPEGSLLLRHERAHGLTFDRAYAAFLKGRLQSLKTGRPPGAPHPVDDDAGQASAADEPGPGPDATRVAEEKVRRKQAAAAVGVGGRQWDQRRRPTPTAWWTRSWRRAAGYPRTQARRVQAG